MTSRFKHGTVGAVGTVIGYANLPIKTSYVLYPIAKVG